MAFLQSIDLTTIISILSLALSTYFFFVSPKQQLIRERYEKLIFPLFSCLEPFLFADVSTVDIQALVSTYKENAVYAGSKINECMYYFTNKPTQQNFNALCNRVNWEYDKYCFLLGFKLRSVTYRINRRQSKTKLLLILYTLFWCLLLLITSLLFLIATVYIASFLAHLVG